MVPDYKEHIMKLFVFRHIRVGAARKEQAPFNLTLPGKHMEQHLFFGCVAADNSQCAALIYLHIKIVQEFYPGQIYR
jgi:hypothetical protein